MVELLVMIKKINLTSDDSLFEKSLGLQKYIEELSRQPVNVADKFSFNWAGKSNAIKSVLIPSKLTLDPKPNESIKWDESENLFIEGDNLEVLKLLQKAYFEKVKMIYIDPPYNTGHDFVYNDNFSAPLDNYLKQTGQKTETGESVTTNKETNGRYHSAWLSMMYPRLKLAWNLLREDGVIFVSIDDNEVHHLRMLMDEVFGEENFVAQLIWEKKYTTSNNIKGISYTHEYIVAYCKDKNLIDKAISRYEYSEEARARFSNPDNDPRGDWSDVSYHGPKSPTERPNLNYPLFHPITGLEIWPKEKSWAYEKERYEQHVAESRLYWGKNNNYAEPRLKVFLSEIEGGIIPKSLLNYEDFGTTSEGRSDLREVFGKNDDGALFDNPKPVRLIQKLIEIGTEKDEIVLDFFTGSGTAAHAVLEQNKKDKGSRKFICVQLPEKVDKKSEAFKAGYKTIADIAKERIRRVIKGYGENPQPIDVGVKVFTLTESNYLENNFEFNSEKSQEENKEAFIAYLYKEKQSQLFDKENGNSIVYENIVKEGLSLNSKVEALTLGKNKVYKVTDVDQQLLICLENKLASETVKELTDKSHKDKLFICLESALDDTTAANLSLNLDLKTI